MNSKLKLTDREWKEFVFGELFEIRSTSSSIDRKRLFGLQGNSPYITRSENSNGIDCFIGSQSHYTMDEANVITIGLDTQTVFYQSYPFYTGQNIQVIRHSKLTKYNALFIIRAIKVLVQKFSWGSYGATLTRLRRGKLFLPIDTKGMPDWVFMGAYMKQVEDELLTEALPKFEQQLLEHIITLGALEDREWKEFLFSDIFTRIQRGRRLKKDDHIKGNIPYVSSTASNNGLDGFIGNTERVRMFSDCITLANSGSVGSAFYQEFSFVASDHVTMLKKNEIDKHAYLFILPIIGRLSEKYSFNREINDTRIAREKFLLPVTVDGLPDWEFMSDFMKRVENETLLPALKHFKNKECNKMLTGGGKIKPYFMEDVVQIINGMRLTRADMLAGCRPFVGASEETNGVTEFVGNTNASLDREVLGVNYNGSVGFSFYHPYEALFSDDVKRVRWKDDKANNKYTLLYLSTAIAQQRSKYAYGYKFNAQRMKRQIIMLPSQPDGTPNYTYMERTMRVMEYEVIMTYLTKRKNHLNL